MRLYGLVIALAFLAAIASDSWGQSKQPSSGANPPSKQSTQPPAPDQRGTDQSPVVVKILPAPNTEKQTEKQEREWQEKELIDKKLAFDTQRIADYTWWLASLTGCLFAIAVIQAGFFFWQLRYMRKGMEDAAIAANAAALSARAAIALELPIITAEPDGFSWGNSRRVGDEMLIDSFGIERVRFFNSGRTAAVLLEIAFGYTIGNHLPSEPSYTLTKPFSIGCLLQSEPFSKAINEFEFDVPAGTYNEFRASSTKIWFYCNLIYLDFMQTRHEAAFCWEKNPGSGSFRDDPAPAYNRKA
jgi:hypothetical protein